jgi:hypothetical protein
VGDLFWFDIQRLLEFLQNSGRRRASIKLDINPLQLIGCRYQFAFQIRELL